MLCEFLLEPEPGGGPVPTDGPLVQSQVPRDLPVVHPAEKSQRDDLVPPWILARQFIQRRIKLRPVKRLGLDCRFEVFNLLEAHTPPATPPLDRIAVTVVIDQHLPHGVTELADDLVDTL